MLKSRSEILGECSLIAASQKEADLMTDIVFFMAEPQHVNGECIDLTTDEIWERVVIKDPSCSMRDVERAADKIIMLVATHKESTPNIR